MVQGSLDLVDLPKAGEVRDPLLQNSLRESGFLPVLPHLTFPLATPRFLLLGRQEKL